MIKQSTPKQRRQQNMRTALGTVIGFNGYLSNLEATLNSTYLYNRGSHHIINALRERLKIYEKEIREGMQKL
jgi:hypothetical protein